MRRAAVRGAVRRVLRVVIGLAAGVSALTVAACTSGKTPSVVARDPLADSADQVFYHAKSRLTDHGVMMSELHADTGYFFDDNTRIEMRVDTTYFFTITGAPNAVLTSREGTYNTRTGNMEARGNVIVTGVDGRQLATPQLRYAQAQNQISSDSPFVLTDTAHRHTTGIGFTSDPDMNNVRCLRACAGTAGVVNLTSTPSDSGHRTPAATAPPSSRAAPPPAATSPAAPSRAPSPAPSAAPGAGTAPPPSAGTAGSAPNRATLLKPADSASAPAVPRSP